MGQELKVLFIAGVDRSGSTLLGNVLGQIEGWFHAGEVRHLWDAGLISNIPCGCRARFHECPVWGAVAARAFGDRKGADPGEMLRLKDLCASRHRDPLLLLPAGRRILKQRARRFLPYLEAVYKSLAEVTGCRVLVDSSKGPAYAHAVSLLPGVDFSVVHLVRDSRGAAFSASRKKLQPDTQRYLSQPGPTRSALWWNIRNLAVTRLWEGRGHYVRIRYEDFVAAPRECVERILGMFDEPGPSLDFIGEDWVRLEVQHTVAGNPSKFAVGTVALRADNEWKTKMRRIDRGWVTALTWPLLRRYGYPLAVAP